MSRAKLMHKLKTLSLVTTTSVGVFAGVCLYKGNDKFYENVVMKVGHTLSPETAHNFAILACKYGLFQKPSYSDPESLRVRLLNLNFDNPVGIAAGFDKQGNVVKNLHDLGFGFIEIGSVTPKPQAGNPKPRVFRLPEDKAIINRYGFNSDGHEAVYKRLLELKTNSNFKGVLGVNLGKNKESDKPNEDYCKGIKLFGPIADYLVVNISSPNTPGLRTLQSKDNLKSLLSEVVNTRNSLHVRPPIFLKLAPDLSYTELKEIAEVLTDKKCTVDGLIISNTTIDRSNLANIQYNQEIGGLSGAPLSKKSTRMIAEMYKLTKGKYPIIGVGGVFDGQDAYEKITAGASLIQIYTSFIYHGPPIIKKIKLELDEKLKANGYSSITEAVGKNCESYLEVKTK